MLKKKYIALIFISIIHLRRRVNNFTRQPVTYIYCRTLGRKFTQGLTLYILGVYISILLFLSFYTQCITIDTIEY